MTPFRREIRAILDRRLALEISYPAFLLELRSAYRNHGLRHDDAAMRAEIADWVERRTEKR